MAADNAEPWSEPKCLGLHAGFSEAPHCGHNLAGGLGESTLQETEREAGVCVAMGRDFASDCINGSRRALLILLKDCDDSKVGNAKHS